ncbi:hypothetical protein QMU91_002529, partial [Flavobacterium psychrophilum]|nr:hypothetical protein [Flavobacterium psychrophilum]
GKNRPSGQFFPSSPRYAGDEKPSLLSHDVLPSPALLDFLREQALSKTPQSGGSLAVIIQKKIEIRKNELMKYKMNKTILILIFVIFPSVNIFSQNNQKIFRNVIRKDGYDYIATEFL